MKIDHLCHEKVDFQANIHFSAPNLIQEIFPFRRIETPTCFVDNSGLSKAILLILDVLKRFFMELFIFRDTFDLF